jgi:hypothetical protein
MELIKDFYLKLISKYDYKYNCDIRENIKKNKIKINSNAKVLTIIPKKQSPRSINNKINFQPFNSQTTITFDYEENDFIRMIIWNSLFDINSKFSFNQTYIPHGSGIKSINDHKLLNVELNTLKRDLIKHTGILNFNCEDKNINNIIKTCNITRHKYEYLTDKINNYKYYTNKLKEHSYINHNTYTKSYFVNLHEELDLGEKSSNIDINNIKQIELLLKKKLILTLNKIRNNEFIDLLNYDPYFIENKLKFISDQIKRKGDKIVSFNISDGSLIGISIDKCIKSINYFRNKLPKNIITIIKNYNKIEKWYGTSVFHIEINYDKKKEMFHVYPTHQYRPGYENNVKIILDNIFKNSDDPFNNDPSNIILEYSMYTSSVRIDKNIVNEFKKYEINKNITKKHMKLETINNPFNALFLTICQSGITENGELKFVKST